MRLLRRRYLSESPIAPQTLPALMLRRRLENRLYSGDDGVRKQLRVAGSGSYSGNDDCVALLEIGQLDFGSAFEQRRYITVTAARSRSVTHTRPTFTLRAARAARRFRGPGLSGPLSFWRLVTGIEPARQHHRHHRRKLAHRRFFLERNLNRFLARQILQCSGFSIRADGDDGAGNCAEGARVYSARRDRSSIGARVADHSYVVANLNLVYLRGRWCLRIFGSIACELGLCCGLDHDALCAFRSFYIDANFSAGAIDRCNDARGAVLPLRR